MFLFHKSLSLHHALLQVFSPTGPLNRDYDDVRRFLDAAVKGMKRAIQAGSGKPVLVVPTTYGEQFTDAVLVAWLGAFYALYTVSVSTAPHHTLGSLHWQVAMGLNKSEKDLEIKPSIHPE